jgi:hypothetical protein
MEFFDKTLYISLVVSLSIVLLVYMYMYVYDKENKERDIFCLKIFILSFSLSYVSLYILCNKKENPIDNIYRTEPDF